MNDERIERLQEALAALREEVMVGSHRKARDMVRDWIDPLLSTFPTTPSEGDGAGEGGYSVEGPVYEAAVKGRADFRAALREARQSVKEAFQPTEDEVRVIGELGAELDLSPGAVIRQALRFYQLMRVRLKAGETFSFSGDAQRAREFAGPLATLSPRPPVDVGGLVEEVAQAVHLGRFRADSEPTPWEAEDASGKAYCRSIARSVLSLSALRQPALPEKGEEPIPMLLFCPACGLKHVDEPEEPLTSHGGIDPVEPDGDHWKNPPHKSHLCHGCGCIWRPADVPTNGVARIETTGKADTFDLNAIPALSPKPEGMRP